MLRPVAAPPGGTYGGRVPRPVVGSSHTGHLGRVLPGSTAERLLHGSPCPVAVVPHGYRSASKGESQMIACAWDGGPESEAALLAAEALAKELSASLRVIAVFEVPRVSRKVMRSAGCPVIVCPNGARSAPASVLAAPATAPA